MSFNSSLVFDILKLTKEKAEYIPIANKKIPTPKSKSINSVNYGVNLITLSQLILSVTLSNITRGIFFKENSLR